MVVVDPIQLAKQAIPEHVKQKILMLEQIQLLMQETAT